MSLFRKKKKDLSKNPFYMTSKAVIMYVRCSKCGEVFRSHVYKGSEIALSYENGKNGYKLRKELIGANCPNTIEVNAFFSSSFKTLSFDIKGGEFITEEEYYKEKVQ